MIQLPWVTFLGVRLKRVCNVLQFSSHSESLNMSWFRHSGLDRPVRDKQWESVSIFESNLLLAVVSRVSMYILRCKAERYWGSCSEHTHWLQSRVGLKVSPRPEKMQGDFKWKWHIHAYSCLHNIYIYYIHNIYIYISGAGAPMPPTPGTSWLKAAQTAKRHFLKPETSCKPCLYLPFGTLGSRTLPQHKDTMAVRDGSGPAPTCLVELLHKS